MRIYIVTLDEPVYFFPFFEKLLKAFKSNIKGVGISTYVPNWQKRGNFFKRMARKAILAFLVYGVKNFFKRISLETFGAVGLIDRNTTSIEARARFLNIFDRKIDDINHPRFIERLLQLKIDVLIFQGSQKLNLSVLSAPTWGCLNRHTALLPSYRGSFPVFWGMTNDEECFGVSIHKMTEHFDEGPILVQKRIKKQPGDTIASLYAKLNLMGAEGLIEALCHIENGTEKITPNKPNEGSYFKTPDLKDLIAYIFKKKCSSTTAGN